MVFDKLRLAFEKDDRNNSTIVRLEPVEVMSKSCESPLRLTVELIENNYHFKL